MKKSFLGLAVLSAGIALPLRSDPQPASEALQGVVLPSRVIHLGAAAEGLLSEVRVDRGDHVKRGQVVATLDFNVQEANMRLAKARTEAMASLESARLRASQAKEDLARRELLVTEGLITEDETNVYRTKSRLADLDEKKAEETKRLAGFEFKRSSALLKQGTILSPINGVVIERFLSAGEMLTKSGSGEVLTLAQLDPLMIELNAPLELFEVLKLGQPAEINFIGIDLGQRRARITVLDRIVDTASDTFRVRLELPNPKLSIPAGLRAEVEFER